MSEPEKPKKKRGRPPGSKTKNTKSTKGRIKTAFHDESNVDCNEIISTELSQQKGKKMLLVHLPININNLDNPTDSVEGEELIKVREPRIQSKPTVQYTRSIPIDKEPLPEEIIPMPEFYDANKTQKWIKSTNIKCKFCTRPFKTVPLAIPKYIDENGVFYVEGCYCSVNCGLAKLIRHYDEADKTHRISLFFYFCSKILGKEVPKDIQPSPEPTDVLVEYGGTMTRAEYGASLMTASADYYLEFPPIVSIIPQVVQFSQYLTEQKRDNTATDGDNANFMNISKLVGSKKQE